MPFRVGFLPRRPGAVLTLAVTLMSAGADEDAAVARVTKR